MINSGKWMTVVALSVVTTAGVNAQSFNNPNISDVPAIYSPNQYIAPNLFFLLDDSGSMWSRISYNRNTVYTIPPNPNDFNSNTGTFNPFPTPGASTGNGFRANGFTTANDNSVSPARWSCGSDANTTNCYIWSSFYSSRSLTMKSALANALVNETRPISVDLNFLHPRRSNINNLNLAALDQNHSSYRNNMARILRTLYRETVGGGTPTRRNVLTIYEGLQNLARANNRNNVFLPLHSKDDSSYSFDQDDLLYCKRNYNVILSDGSYNGGTSATADTDAQNATFTWRDSSGDVSVDFRGDGSVPVQRLFAGGPSSLRRGRSTLTDIVFNNWLQDLNTALVNDVTARIRVPGTTVISSAGGTQFQVPEIWNRNNNPAQWQNLITATIGLGIGRPITDTAIANKMASQQTPHSWPTNSVNDFVRSGYVGRGGFYRTDSSQDLQNAFATIIAAAADDSQTLSASAVTITSGQITSSANNLMFSTNFDPRDWTGDLNATWLYSGVESSTPSLPSDKNRCFDTTPAEIFVGRICTADEAKWSAQEALTQKNWQSRKIFSITRNADVSEGIDFIADQMNAEQLAHFSAMHDGSPGDLDNSVSNQDIVDFLSGDQTLIDSQNTIVQRPNDGLLGDFGRGSPVYLGNPNPYIWGSDESSWPINKNARHVVFAGNNDGMLHAFDALNGEELFAYVPYGVYSNLNSRVLQSLSHEAMVDGQVAVQDIIDIHEGDAKKTILVSGLGAGGKGLFALNVTEPDRFDRADVLWELGRDDDSRLGRIFGKPSIIRVEGEYKGRLGSGSAEENRWVVVVGTGYNNRDADSGIMVIDATSGEILDFLKLPGAQGLGEIVWVDHQKLNKVNGSKKQYFGDNSLWGEVDRGYVADLLGNIWVLDFAYDKDNSETQLRSAITVDSENDAGTVNDRAHLKSLLATPVDTSEGVPAPLFIATDQAGNRQPITAKITVNKHPSGRGYMLYVGTGDILNGAPLVDKGNCTTIDCSGTDKLSANSIYGIWDDIGRNLGNIATKEVEQYNVTRDRRFLTFYPWEQTQTTFANGAGAYARVTDTSGDKVEIKTPIKWANLTGFEDSKAVSLSDYASDPVISSGWLTDTGFNVALRQSERVFQPAALIINESGEAGITFYMHTLDTAADDSDPCAPKSNIKTWQLTYRADIIDGPLATFSAPVVDINSDGNIDVGDKIENPSLVPLGAVPTLESKYGKDRLWTGYTISEGSPSSVKPLVPEFCDNGITRTYTTTLSDGTKKQITACRPFARSSWTEFE